MNNGFPLPLLGRKPALASRFIAAFVSLVCTSAVAVAVIAATNPLALGGLPPLESVIGYSVYALPAWCVGYLPLFLFFGSSSPVWRWYLSIPIGALLGLLSFLTVFGGSISNFAAPGFPDRLPGYIPTLLAAAVFLCGSLFNAFARAQPLSPTVGDGESSSAPH